MRSPSTLLNQSQSSQPARDGVLGETTIYLIDVPDHLPTGHKGRRTHPSTCLRWVLRGVRGVRLEAVRLGGRWVTSLEALSRFGDRVTATAASAAPVPSPPAIGRRRADHVDQELDATGI